MPPPPPWPRTSVVVTRPTSCPSCKSGVIDTLAKTVTETTCWRCRDCEHTWTIAGLRAAAPRPRMTR